MFWIKFPWTLSLSGQIEEFGWGPGPIGLPFLGTSLLGEFKNNEHIYQYIIYII